MTVSIRTHFQLCPSFCLSLQIVVVSRRRTFPLQSGHTGRLLPQHSAVAAAASLNAHAHKDCDEALLKALCCCCYWTASQQRVNEVIITAADNLEHTTAFFTPTKTHCVHCNVPNFVITFPNVACNKENLTNLYRFWHVWFLCATKKCQTITVTFIYWQ